MAAEAEQIEDVEEPKKKSKGLLFGLIGAVLLGGGTFFGVYSGMVPLPFGGGEVEESHGGEVGEDGKNEHVDGENQVPGGPTYAFVPLEPLIISLGPEAKSKHLKVSITVEVVPGTEEAVLLVTPRINDVLNTFLRAVDEREFEIPRSMLRLRAQMLRRVQLVTPKDSVRDVLIQEFVLN